MDGEGEIVGGIILMFKGGNFLEVINNVYEWIELVKKLLLEGLELYVYFDCFILVEKVINIVKKNFLEGGLIVVLVLILLLGNLWVGLIVVFVIFLVMFFVIIFMNYFGVLVNLMLLGVIDFGIVVDGVVIVVEGVFYIFFIVYVGR